MISKESITTVQQIPLVEVMNAHGLTQDHRDKKYAWYHCPLHQDRTASLRVDLFPNPNTLRNDMPCARFYCESCGKRSHMSGAGAIELEAALDGHSASPDVFMKYLRILAKRHHVLLLDTEGNQAGGYRSSSEPSERKEIEVQTCSWTDEHLRALGCAVRTETGADGVEVKSYSWGGTDYYGRGEHTQSRLFSAQQVTQDFGILPVRDYWKPAIYSEQKGEYVSFHVEDEGDYPIFWWRYTYQGRWYGRIYEPYASGNHPRFSWFWQDGLSVQDFLSHQLYGDMELMDALEAGSPTVLDDTRHPVVRHRRSSETDPKETESYYLFHRIVICSGPRDAMQVYYHSDAHVCWPHSENTDLTLSDLQRLQSLCEELYICYDMDRTGQDNMERTVLDFPELRMIYLPEDLPTLTNKRNGNPCKDISDFFEYYEAVMRRTPSLRYKSINAKFEDMLTDADSCKFWVEQKRKVQDDFGELQSTYEILTNRLARFLSLLGLRKYQDESGATQYVLLIERTILKVVPDGELERLVDELVKSWLSTHSAYNNERIKQAVSSSRLVNRKTISGIRSINPNFVYWTEQMDMLLFANGALRVTPDDMKLIPYEALEDCYVNYDAVHWDKDWDESNRPVFQIEPSPEIAAIEREHRQNVLLLQQQNAPEAKFQLEDAQYEAKRNISSWKFTFLDANGRPCKPEEAPDVVQFVYDTSRIFWQEEEADTVTEEQLQFQRAHMVNKCAALGYMLSQFRTKRHIQMVMATEYAVADERHNHGRTGKSMFFDLLYNVRKSPAPIPGKRMKDEVDPKLFSGFILTVHGWVMIDDVHTRFDPQLIFNDTVNLHIKTLYKNEYTCPWEISPKIAITSNKPFDWLNDDSIRGRIYNVFMSDYYHQGKGSSSPGRSFDTKFHYELGKSRDHRQQQAVYMFLAQCLQFYLRILDVPRAPIEGEARKRMVRVGLRDMVFCEWFESILARYMGVPLAERDLIISYLRSRNTKNIDSGLVGETKAELNRKMRSYCNAMGILMNPDEAISSLYDREKHRLRITTWRYRFDSHKHIDGRERVNSVDCCVFFDASAEVGLAQTPSEDPGADDYVAYE